MCEKGIKLTLSGDMACFRKPETNSSQFITFGTVHKVVLCGIFGAIVGFKGYESCNGDVPEFYEKFKDLKISIVTEKKNVIQQMISFNNSTGIASFHEGGNLIVKETILCNPSWDIYVMDDGSDEYNLLKEYLISKKCVYIPYLGRNDYPANISNVTEVEFERICEEYVVYDSFVKAIASECKSSDWGKKFFKSEKLPIGLEENTKHYKYENFLLTNDLIPLKENSYKCDTKNIAFI